MAAESNRRKFVRHPSSLPMCYRRMGYGSECNSDLRNIGHGGIAFISSKAIDVGSLLEISVPALDDSQVVVAQVLWCKSKADSFEIGVSFADDENAFKARMVEQACQIEVYRRELEQAEGQRVDPERAAREWIAKFAAEFEV